MALNKCWKPCVGIAIAILAWPHGGQLEARNRLAQPIVVAVPDPSEYEVRADLPYRERDGRRLLMDVFTPAKAPGEAVPAVIFVHGGPLPPSVASQGKDLGQFQSFGPFVTAAGVAGIAFSHGFSGPDALEDASADVEAAIEYIRENAEEWSVDPDRLCLAHVSAGGLFLAPFLAQRPTWLKCVVLYYPVLRPGVLEQFGAADVSPEQKSAFDPFPFITPPGQTAPALFIAEAGRDAPALNAELRQLREAAVASGWRVEHCDHPDGPHGFDVFDPSERSRGILMRTREFLQQELGLLPASETPDDRMQSPVACGARS